MLVAADTDVVTGKLICYGFVELHHLTNNQENYVFQMLLTKNLIKTLCYAQTFIKHKYIHKIHTTSIASSFVSLHYLLGLHLYPEKVQLVLTKYLC